MPATPDWMSDLSDALMFGAFLQGRAVRRKGVEGTRLGLHLSRRLAELLGGELQCYSVPGHGSRVLSLWGASS